MLPNSRHERFAQEIAIGTNIGAAYKEAGYSSHQSGATALLKNPKIANRIEELRGRQVSKYVVTRQLLSDAAVENLEKALGRRPVKMGADGIEVFVYRGDVANRVLQMLGSALDLFVERKEIKHSLGDYDKYSDAQLVEILQQEAKALLEDHSSAKVAQDDTEE